MNNFYKGAFFSLLSAFGFALLPIFALYAYRGHISVTTLLFFRFSIAAVLFFLYVFVKYKGLVFHKKDLLYLFILGGICYNLQARFYFSSVKYIPASLAALFLYTYPLIVTGLSFLVDREKITGKMGVSIGISFLGLILIWYIHWNDKRFRDLVGFGAFCLFGLHHDREPGLEKNAAFGCQRFCGLIFLDRGPDLWFLYRWP